MKKTIYVILFALLISNIGQSQMTVGGKLRDIKGVTKQNVMKAMTGEFGHASGPEDFSIKIDLQGNFKMFYSRTIKSRAYNQGDGGWTLRLSGKVTLYDADFVSRTEPITDRYGDIINTNVYYTKYYAVFRGKDQNGKDHSFCCSIQQRFDNKYMYPWQMSWTDKVPNCYCEDTNEPQSVCIPFATELN